MARDVIDYNKYENLIRVGHTAVKNSDGSYTCSDLADFPTPSALGRTLHDVDVDAYTDLKGYTHRNRVRHDVEDISLTYPILSDDDLAFILNKLSPAWVYVELTDKKTKQKKVHKMYASDKSFNTFRSWTTTTGNVTTRHEEVVEFAVSLVEE